MLPKSKLGAAFTYAFNQKEGLMNYLLDGNCAFSNNLAKHSIRPFTIGRKNWLFSGSPAGAAASAGIYSLIETAKANGINPNKYIKFILSDIPGSAFMEYPGFLEDYMPWMIRKLAAYMILGINPDGHKEVLTIEVGENESSKYWLSILNGLKNRGVKDILILCADGLSGIKEAIAAAYPKTEYQRCIVHQVRNTMKYVSDKDRKPFCADIKTIYQAPTDEKALDALERATEKWSGKYPNSMRNWNQNWDAISPIFKFSTAVRRVIYTTNAIESLNATYRKLNRQRSVFPSDTALLKALYLSTFEATKKWTMPIRNWGQVYGELSIMYEGRLPE